MLVEPSSIKIFITSLRCSQTNRKNKHTSYMQCIFNYNEKMVFPEGKMQHKNTINCMYIVHATLRPEEIIDTKTL
ncbi:hypothetical protein GAF94_23320 [Escherichia coli]|nr:hypothetical protein [Escherichia coli]EFC6685042.1 hypothetical protein [Escherichia coli]EFH9540735.1 hypothetical protein [Escherichia coli]MCI5458118.1 hypothetical protein [Escherichia coli]